MMCLNEVSDAELSQWAASVPDTMGSTIVPLERAYSGFVVVAVKIEVVSTFLTKIRYGV